MKYGPERRGFSMMEVLIVVVVFGIISAIAIPHLSDTTYEAQASTLMNNLRIMRTSLDLYKLQHNNQYPPNLGAGDTTITQLVGVTKADHSAGGSFGPYVNSLPDNPFTTTNEVSADAVQADGSKAGAWYYKRSDADPSQMDFRANDSKANYDNL